MIDTSKFTNVIDPSMFDPDPSKPQSKGPREPYDHLIIDGGGLVTTAWSTHRDLERAEDRVRASVYVFVTCIASLSRLIADGAKIMVVWDGYDNRAFRRGRHPWYKHGRGSVINRKEVRVVMNELTPLLEAMGVAVVKKDKHEADDLIGTITREMKEDGKRVLVFSDDKDYYQLVDEYVHQCRRSMDGIIVDPDQGTLMGVPFGHNYLRIKAIMGDSGDNIKGLIGIGESKAKKAIELNPDFVEQCEDDPSEVDWSAFDETLLRAFIRAGRKLVWPPCSSKEEMSFAKGFGASLDIPIQVTDPEIEDEACLEAAAREVAWSFNLVSMDRHLQHEPIVFPTPNVEAIPAQMTRLDLINETDLISSMYRLAGFSQAPDARRAAVRAGQAVENPNDRF